MMFNAIDIFSVAPSRLLDDGIIERLSIPSTCAYSHVSVLEQEVGSEDEGLGSWTATPALILCQNPAETVRMWYRSSDRQMDYLICSTLGS
jgi:hypothetical protein